ncbi:CPBP family intramembrane glutamic endopeptidase [Corynebacterium guangdongense]|uniref:Membrane protease YdiL (CAAX protease family) n=1 Tax=Corynebacterium guangdongense TaxID=1783348 RepID=A0ABU1ZVN1_9CORY|nr:CPBP family intramembrane glutamic endopeptidase [Corynebacterium guangdongense]MDR7328965.1 membrane protease YdiL (CAAX protease family) [Corynebacterium guangdongense]WJZ17538.1 CAAX amino terminal protease self- immunity [Corynebacterium guangdongense]
MNSRAVAVFLAVAFGLAYLIDAVVAATDSLGTALGLGLILVRMLTPLVATVVVCRWVTHERWPVVVGLGRASLTDGRWRRVLAYSLLGIVLVAATTFLATGAAILGGWLIPDWAMSATLQKSLDAGAGTLPPAPVLAALFLVQATLFGATINALFALGEEVGWRGWLHTALEPLGPVPTVGLTGLVWGLWHAPLIMMGYNYDDQLNPVLAVGAFTLFCMVFGAVLTWLRTVSASVIPAAVAHGVFNAFSTLPAVLVASGDTWDRVMAGPVGLPTAVIFAAVAALLWAVGGARVGTRALSR